jgi:UTP--glucose-1-phosphate uridylyltransferase
VEYTLKRPELRDRFMKYLVRSIGPLLEREEELYKNDAK